MEIGDHSKGLSYCHAGTSIGIGEKMNGNKFSSAELYKSDIEAIDFGLSVLSPRWTSAILLDLSAGAKRTTHMLKDLPGISAKTLCQRLRRLCELQLVKRTTFPEVPPRVEYNLTAKGEELTSVLSALKGLGKELESIQNQNVRTQVAKHNIGLEMPIQLMNSVHS